jgi:hypothetical protein
MKTEDSTVDLNRQLEAYAIASPPERNPQSRWGNWPIYAAATGAALAVASAASADIIYSGPINISGSAVNLMLGNNQSIGFFDDNNVVRHFVSSTGPNGVHYPSQNLVNDFAEVAGPVFFNSAYGGFPKNFPAGAPISGPNLRAGTLATVRTFVTHQGHAVFGPGSGGGGRNYFAKPGFLGMELVQPNGSVEPGWIQVQFTPTFPGLFDVTGWAYNTDGPIDAGQTSATPEPSYLPLMLLAAGAAGVLAWKRSRRPQAPNA